MFTLFGIGFTAPWLLLGLLALPILWILLRAVPPAPIRRLFPGVALLLGLTDRETQTDKTPWWLLLIRILAVAALIIGFAGPVLNPKEQATGGGPLLILTDGTWASARDWPQRQERIRAALDASLRSGRPVAIASLTDLGDGALQFQSADIWRSRLPGITPMPWQPDPAQVAEWADGLTGAFETLWLSDGLARDERDALLVALRRHGVVTVFQSARPVLGLRPALFEGGIVKLAATRAAATGASEIAMVARGPDPSGVERDLSRAVASFAAGEKDISLELSLPPELRNRITRFQIDGVRSAGAVALTDDSLRRREVALVAGSNDREGLELLSQVHYLHQALEPTADLIEGTIGDIILANPDAIFLADVATLSAGETEDLLDWVDRGGMLVRFAGPRLAGSDVSREAEDPLMPVRLRVGGRSIGGAMSWGEPKKLRPFSETSPFFGLPIPDDVLVSAQVLAQPDPQLSERTIASLADGTPLVTRKRVGAGQIVLFHVTANAEWSTLPLSGLFVQMLERLAISTRSARPTAEELAGSTWVPAALLDASGTVSDAGTMAGVPGEQIADGTPGPATPPGLYKGDERFIALNVISDDTTLTAATWPPDLLVEGLTIARETSLKGLFLAAALFLLMVDTLASLWLSGRMRGPRSAAALSLMVALAFQPADGRAQETNVQDDSFAINATAEVVLAHVVTGNDELDRIAFAGLRGLSDVLFARTSVEPSNPMGVDIERDELSFFPLLYWPVTPDQPQPSVQAYAKLNRYLRTGGMIVFDTRDADTSRFGAASPNGRKLRQLALPLDIPPLEQIPGDHVLTRTFYLLQDFPGRHASRDVWVEAAPPDAELVEGMPFRNLNDNVTPVIIGGNDWAAAWATDSAGNWMLPVGRGLAGERQREIAYRFGVNLVMHVLTGNYKSDQVHVPALLDRLGQ